MLRRQKICHLRQESFSRDGSASKLWTWDAREKQFSSLAYEDILVCVVLYLEKSILKTYDCVNRDFFSNGILHFKKFEYMIWLSDVSIFMSHFFRNFILFSTFVPFDRISMSVWFQFHYVNLPHWSISRLTFNAFTFNRKLKSRFIWWLCHIMALNLNVRILSNEDTRLIVEGIDTWWYIENINLICD